MAKKPAIPVTFYRSVLIILSLLLIFSAVQIRQSLAEKGILTSSLFWNSFTQLLFGFGFILAGINIILIFSRKELIIFSWLENKIRSFNNMGVMLIVVLCYLFYIFYLHLHTSFLEIVDGFYSRALFLILTSFIISILVQNICNKEKRLEKTYLIFFFIPLVLVISQRLVVEISAINNIPFSNSWAEASHLYFSSAVFSRNVYGYSVPLCPSNLTRYLMQSLPFLFNGMPVWIHRAWQFFLNTALTLVFSILLVMRLRPQSKTLFWAAISFCFLWLSQIYIYYHLIVIALLILAFYRNNNWKRNIVVIFIASFWAGFSRINWIPVAGFLAAYLFILESTLKEKTSFWKYIQKPLLYSVIGMVSGFIAQLIFITIIGNNDAGIHSAFLRSFLLWYRLFPNPTFPPGILPGILLMSGFMIFFNIKYFFVNQGIILVRRILIALILITFFIGGLVVSIKIGGGNNLHNMDAFTVFLIILTGYVFFRRVNIDKKLKSANLGKYLSVIMAGILITPILWSLVFPFQPNPSKMNQAGASNVIAEINEVIDEFAPNRKVLFISQRQLLTFNYLKNIRMVPDFEQELLMEMVISGDRSRLEPFYQQLIKHGYEVIISYPLSTLKVGNEMPYAEENNLWVSGVSSRIYNHYETVALYPEYEIEMLIPKSK